MTVEMPLVGDRKNYRINWLFYEHVDHFLTLWISSNQKGIVKMKKSCLIGITSYYIADYCVQMRQQDSILAVIHYFLKNSLLIFLDLAFHCVGVLHQNLIHELCAYMIILDQV